MPDDAFKDWLAGEILKLRKVRDIQAANYHVNVERAYRDKDVKGLPKPVLIPAIMADALVNAAVQYERIERGERNGSETGSNRRDRNDEDGGGSDE